MLFLPIALGGCGSWSAASSTSPIVEEIPSDDPIDEAIEWRRLVGLRADAAYVQALQSDDAARARARASGLGFPVTEGEAVEMNRRISTMPQVGEVITAYGEGRPDWGGVYADNARGVVVASFTSDVEQHRADLARLLHPAARWEVRQVTRPLSALRALADRVTAEAAWFRTEDAYFSGAGPDQRRNDVVVNVQSRDPTIATTVIDHFGATGIMRVVVSDRMPWTGPYGTIVISAVDEAGDPAQGVYCWLVTDPAAWEEAPEVTGDEGTCHLRAGAADVVAQIRRPTEAGWVVPGEERARIPANGTIEVRITVLASP
jgi:hypothetical protein